MSAILKSQYQGFFVALLLLSTFVIPACSSLGYENVDTTRKAIIVANAEIREANLLLQDLVIRNVITDASAVTALNALREAHAGLQTALAALIAGGDPAAAQSTLDRVNRSLSLVILLLSTYSEESTP